MIINSVSYSLPQERLNRAGVPNDEYLPLDSFQSVSSNPRGTVNFDNAVNAIFGKKDLFKIQWSLKTEDINFLNGGAYCGPVPLKTATSLFIGDGHNYRRINQGTGSAEWEFKLDADDSFVKYDPVVTKDGLICLRYDHGFIRKSDGWKDSAESVVVLDSQSGKERFRYAEKTGIYDRVDTDSNGNFYFATIKDQKLYCVGPDGTMKQLNNPEKGKEEFLCDFKVTGDGTVFYPHLNSNTMVRLKNGRETTFKVEGKNICKFHPLDNGQVIVISDTDNNNPDREVVTCYTGTGKKVWEKRVEKRFSNITVAPDGKMFLMRHGDSTTPSILECLAPDGASQWQFSFDDPAIRSNFNLLDCKFRVGPDGDFLVLSNRGGNVLNIRPDGTEGWKITNRGNYPQYSITHDEKLYMINRGDFEKIDLKTGKTEIDYSATAHTLTRYAEGLQPEVFRSKDEDHFNFQGIILQKDEKHLFSFDENGNFCAVELPGTVELSDSSEEEAVPVSSERIEVFDDYVIIDGVLLPKARSTIDNGK